MMVMESPPFLPPLPQIFNGLQFFTVKIPILPTGRKFSFEFEFRYFANGKFAEFRFRQILDF